MNDNRNRKYTAQEDTELVTSQKILNLVLTMTIMMCQKTTRSSQVGKNV